MNGGDYLPSLVVYVAWHPEFVRGRAMAERIYGYFARDPDKPNARGLGIPAYYPDFKGYDREVEPKVLYVTLTEYDKKYSCLLLLVPRPWTTFLGSGSARREKNSSGLPRRKNTRM